MRSRKVLPILVLIASAAVCLSLARPTVQGAPPRPGVGSGTYQVDPRHSTVLFRIKHLDTSWVYGRFDSFSGTITADAKAPGKSSVSIEIAMDSVDTGTPKRDAHIKGPDFFDAVQFPTATFASQTVKKVSDGQYTVSGDFTLHGVKKPLSVDLEEVGASDTKMGVRAGFLAVFTIQRRDFGIGLMPEALGDEVQVTVSIEAVRTDASGK